MSPVRQSKGHPNASSGSRAAAAGLRPPGDAESLRPPGDRLLMSRAGYEELRAEHERLCRQRREEMADRLRETHEFGSTANNDEYLALREEQMVLDARIERLEEALARAAVVDPGEAEEGRAVIGASVTIEDLDTEQRGTYRLVGAHEQLTEGAISAASPIGQALLGCTAGTVLTVALPRGRSRTLRLVAVDYEPHARAA